MKRWWWCALLLCACSREVGDFAGGSAGIAAFTVTPAQFTVGDTVTFAGDFFGTGRIEPLGLSLVSGKALQVAPSFTVGATSQTFTLSLVASDSAGGTATRNVSVTVFAAPPVPVISAAAEVTANSSNLIAETPAVSGFAFSWSIAGAGSISGDGLGARALFNAGDVGQMVLTCTATNAVGAKRSTAQTIAVDGLKLVWALQQKTSDGSATLGRPTALASDGEGGAFVSDSEHATIAHVFSDGTVVRFAGLDQVVGQGDGPRLGATFSSPGPLAFDGQHRLWIIDLATLRRIDDNGIVTTLIADARFANASALAVTDAGDALIAIPQALLRVSNAAVTTIATAPAAIPAVVALSDGTALYAQARAGADANHLFTAQTVQQIDLSSLAVTHFSGLVDTTDLFGVNASAGIVDGSASQALINVEALALASDGSVVFADAENGAVRTLAADGTVSTLAWQKLATANPIAPSACQPRLAIAASGEAFQPTAIAPASLTDTWVISGGVFLLRTPPP